MPTEIHLREGICNKSAVIPHFIAGIKSVLLGVTESVAPDTTVASLSFLHFWMGPNLSVALLVVFVASAGSEKRGSRLLLPGDLSRKEPCHIDFWA